MMKIFYTDSETGILKRVTEGCFQHSGAGLGAQLIIDNVEGGTARGTTALVYLQLHIS
jgi:hypothetical protein